MSAMDRIEHEHALRVCLHAHRDPIAALRSALDARYPPLPSLERIAEVNAAEAIRQAAYDLEHDPVCFQCGEALDDNYQCPPCELAHDLAQWEQKQ